MEKAMNNVSLEDALTRIIKGKKENEDQGSNPINLLLQIILPITLILAIVVYTRANDYNILIKDVTEGPFHEQLVRAYLAIQKQVLLRMLEEAKVKEGEYLGIDLADRDLQNVGFTFFNERLVQDEYKDVSKRTYDHLYERRSQVEDSIFYAVINRTDEELIKVGEEARLQSKSLRQILEIKDIEGERKNLLKFAQEDIRKFMELFSEECANMQIRIIHSIHGYFGKDLQKLDKWDPQLKTLVELYQQAKSKEETDIHSQAIFKRLHEKVKEDFEKQNVPFLPKTWEKKRLKFENVRGGAYVNEQR